MTTIRISFAIMFLSMFFSCRISSNENLIEYFTDELKLHRDEYNEIVYNIDTINTQNIRYSIHRYSNFEKHLVVDEYFPMDSSFVKDFEFPESLDVYFLQRKITKLFVKGDTIVIFGYLHKRNLDFGDVCLVYFPNEIDNGIFKYKESGFLVYSNDDVPKNNSKWIYKLDMNWGIISYPPTD